MMLRLPSEITKLHVIDEFDELDLSLDLSSSMPEGRGHEEESASWITFSASAPFSIALLTPSRTFFLKRSFLLVPERKRQVGAQFQ